VNPYWPGTRLNSIARSRNCAHVIGTVGDGSGMPRWANNVLFTNRTVGATSNPMAYVRPSNDEIERMAG
jgi:hypothetical protein